MNTHQIDEDVDLPIPDDVAGRGDRGPGLAGWAWRGGTIGFRRAGPAVGPIAVAALVLALPSGAFGLGSGRGRGPHSGVPVVQAPFPADDNADPGGRRPLVLWLVGVPAPLALTAAFGYGVYLGRAVDLRLEAAIAEADRDDPSWRLDDLMAAREPVPDEENSALVAAEAVALLPEGWPASAPSPPSERPNSPETPLLEALERLGKTPDNVRLDDAASDTLRAKLGTLADAVRVARTLGGYRRGRHELVLGPTLIDTPLDEALSARALARLLAVDAAIRAQDGDLDGALDSCRSILGSGRSIGDEPFLVSQLIRAAIGGVASGSARRVLAQGEPSDAALARLQALILDEMAQPLLLYSMTGERATNMELIRRVGAGKLTISAITGVEQSYAPDILRPMIPPRARLMLDNQRAVALEWLNVAVAIARRPAHEWIEGFDALIAEVRRVRRIWHAPHTARLPLVLLPVITGAGTTHLRYQADLGSTALLLAAERHRLRTGDWPDSVGAIERDILPSPPLDPFTGEPYRLDRRDGRLLIHSVGPDREDDHGEFDARRWMIGGPDDVGAVAWDVPLRGRLAPPEGE